MTNDVVGDKVDFIFQHRSLRAVENPHLFCGQCIVINMDSKAMPALQSCEITDTLSVFSRASCPIRLFWR